MAIGLGGSGHLTVPYIVADNSRTLTAVGRHNSTANIGSLLTQNDPASAGGYDYISLRGDVVGDPAELQTKSTVTMTTRVGTFTVDTFTAVTGSATPSGNGVCTKDGTDGVTAGWPSGGVPELTLSLGAFGYGGSWFDRLNGAIANVGYYGVELTSRERKALTTGWPPRRIRPAELQISVPGVRQLQEMMSGATITQVGTAPTVARHPRTYGFP